MSEIGVVGVWIRGAKGGLFWQDEVGRKHYWRSSTSGSIPPKPGESVFGQSSNKAGKKEKPSKPIKEKKQKERERKRQRDNEEQEEAEEQQQQQQRMAQQQQRLAEEAQALEEQKQKKAQRREQQQQQQQKQHDEQQARNLSVLQAQLEQSKATQEAIAETLRRRDELVQELRAERGNMEKLIDNLIKELDKTRTVRDAKLSELDTLSQQKHLDHSRMQQLNQELDDLRRQQHDQESKLNECQRQFQTGTSSKCRDEIQECERRHEAQIASMREHEEKLRNMQRNLSDAKDSQQALREAYRETLATRIALEKEFAAFKAEKQREIDMAESNVFDKCARDKNGMKECVRRLLATWTGDKEDIMAFIRDPTGQRVAVVTGAGDIAPIPNPPPADMPPPTVSIPDAPPPDAPPFDAPPIDDSPSSPPSKPMKFGRSASSSSKPPVQGGLLGELSSGRGRLKSTATSTSSSKASAKHQPDLLQSLKSTMATRRKSVDKEEEETSISSKKKQKKQDEDDDDWMDY